MSHQKLSDFIDQIQGQGRYTFKFEDLTSDRSHISTQAALRRLKQRHRIVSPHRGFFVVVRPEYRSLGSPPANWFIDELMAHLKQPYYVALLSAAALHGAAHQQPMIFQVMTDRPTRSIDLGSINISFHMTRDIENFPTKKMQTETGYIKVATPETTAFDIVKYTAASGHLNNVATVLTELEEKLDADQLVKTAPLYATPDVQRLGFILENFSNNKALVAPLLEYYQKLRRRPVLLSPKMPSKEKSPDKNWCVVPNETIETDL